MSWPTFVNRSFCDLFRVSVEDMKHQSLFGPGAGQFKTPSLQTLLQDVHSKGAEIKDLEIDQEFVKIGRRSLMLNARTIDASETILIAIEDITERKQAQEETEKSQATIRALLESTTQSIIAVDTNERIVLANGNVEEMFGYRPEEIIGQSLETLVPDTARGRHAEHHKAYFANMQSRPMGIGLTLEARRKDGTSFPVEVGLSAIETDAGKRAVAFVSDITQRKSLERAAQAHAQEIQVLAASLLTAQEEERRRVSRELHDQICQQLASLAIDIGGLAAEAPTNFVQDRLKALQARVVKASEETRHIAYELHSSVLDDLGLEASLKDLCNQFCARNPNIALEFTADKLPVPVPRAVASCLYRVTQESLQNIEKHAGAKHASVALTWQKGTAVLTVSDDGAGFDSKIAKGQGGIGLIGMEERVRLVQGKLTITTEPGVGARIVIEIPLTKNPA